MSGHSIGRPVQGRVQNGSGAMFGGPRPNAMPVREKISRKGRGAATAQRNNPSTSRDRNVAAKSASYGDINNYDSAALSNGHSAKNNPNVFGGDLEVICGFLVSVAREVGIEITTASSRPRPRKVSTKMTSSDLVTETDQKVEKIIKKRIDERYPFYSFLGEESALANQGLGDSPTFVVDPIDGTTNFVHGHPYVSVSLGFTFRKEPIVGVVYNPFTLEMYTAIKGKGAYMITPSKARQQLPIKSPLEPLGDLGSTLVITEWGKDRQGAIFDCKSKTILNLVKAKSLGGACCHSARTLGGAALSLCAVACGGIDLYWEGGTYAWDICAGWVILKEAGGMIVDGNPGGWNIGVENRTFLAVRPSPQGAGQKEAIQQFWSHVVGRMEYGRE